MLWEGCSEGITEHESLNTNYFRVSATLAGAIAVFFFVRFLQPSGVYLEGAMLRKPSVGPLHRLCVFSTTSIFLHYLFCFSSNVDQTSCGHRAICK